MPLPMAAAMIGSSVLGGLFGSSSARRASQAQERASQAAIAEQQRQFDQTRQDQQPWMQAGQNALGQLQNPMASFQQSPGFNFLQQQGTRGIERSAAARGGAASGNALKALAEFNTGLASQDFGNWWNRQAGLAGVGQSATNAMGQFGAQASGNIGNALMAGGEARASGIMGQANAITGAANTGLNNYMLQRGGWFDRPTQQQPRQPWDHQTGQAGDGLGFHFPQSQRR